MFFSFSHKSRTHYFISFRKDALYEIKDIVLTSPVPFIMILPLIRLNPYFKFRAEFAGKNPPS